MDLNLIREGGVGALAAMALGALGTVLGGVAMVALLGRSRAAFTVGLAALLVGAATAGAGVVGTLYGRSQTERALAYVGSKLDVERIHRAGFREAQSASWVGLFAALLPLALGGLAAVGGSRVKAPQTRRQGFAEPVVSTDEGMGQSVVAFIFVGITAVACGGAWAMAHSALPKLRFDFPEDDSDAWALASALDQAKSEGQCMQLSLSLEPFWDASRWPRTAKREVPAVLSGWRARANECARSQLEGLSSVTERDWLLTSPLLQEDALRAQVQAWQPPGAPEEAVVGDRAPDKELIARAVRAERKAVTRCYEQALVKAPSLAGKLVVQFVIGVDGRVRSAVEAEGAPFPDAKVTACVLERMKQLQFPPATEGEVTVKYPFIFQSGG